MRPAARGTLARALAAAWIAAPAAHAAPEAEGVHPCAPLLESAEFVTHPTPTSIRIGVVPAAGGRFAVTFASERGDHEGRTGWRRAEPGAPLDFGLAGLRPGQRYRYRLLCQAAPGAAPERGPERGFTPLRPPGEAVRFAFLTDSHAYREWSRARLRDDPLALDSLRTLEGTLDHVLGSQLDFMITGGDEVMTHCTRCPGGAIDGTLLVGNTVRSRTDAELRYRVLRRLFARAAHSTPLFTTLGNHDGEAGFGDAEGRCGHYDTTRPASLAARRRYLAGPPARRAGPDGNYFAFESGDALFVVLDVMAYTRRYPQTPEDWTLGTDQLGWLEEVLAASPRAWKFVLAHHVIGGHPRRPCYAYGRGGLRATRDGSLGGRFRGEQARVHALMRRHGAQFFLYGHDHVFAFGEKAGAGGAGEGVYYVAGGKSSSRGSTWFESDWFQELYDYDGDGSGDFLTAFGFLRVTIDGPRSVRFEYVASDPGAPERDGRVLFDRTVRHPAGEEAATRTSSVTE